MTYATFKKLRKSFFCISIFLGITVYFFGNTSNNKTDSLAQNYNLETTQETVATQENQLLEEETVATQENQLLEEKAVAFRTFNKQMSEMPDYSIEYAGACERAGI